MRTTMSDDEEFEAAWTVEREWAAKGANVANPIRVKEFDPVAQGVKYIHDRYGVSLTDVSSQPHYTVSAIQPIDYINANEMDFIEGNIIKYATRWKHKNGIEDLEKLVDYAKRLLAREKSK